MLLGGAGLGLAAVPVALGVRNGSAARERSTIPPRATSHPGLSLGTASAPHEVQVIIDPTTEAARTLVGHVGGALVDLSGGGAVVVLRLWGDGTDVSEANRWCCADVVGQLPAMAAGTSPGGGEFEALVGRRACWDFATSMSAKVRSLGIAPGTGPLVYVDGLLTSGVVADPAKFSTRAAWDAILKA